VYDPTLMRSQRSIKKPLPAGLFRDYGENAEMRWEAMAGGSYVTANDRFYVRNHGPTPVVDAAAWRLRVEGPGVERGLELGHEALLGLGGSSVVCNLECAGNGRIFFEEEQGRPVAGTPWRLGAVGVAEWTGVPLRELLERAGLKENAVEVVPEGADGERRPLPVSKALEEDTILAYAMNGEPLGLDHGFPARVVVPGWYAVASIKWVCRIHVSEEAVLTPWNTEEYVMVGAEGGAPGTRGPALTVQGIKSTLELPWPGRLAAGRHTLSGRAWSGGGEISHVDYSLDGAEWRRARLEGPNSPRAWTRFVFEWDAPPGRHEIRLRATDAAGNTQPDAVPYNELGYHYNAVVGHPVTVY
jgi:DMSO/TMAO reductase YedYZ molybdopterin-dependent catalytic subunit